MVKNTVMFSNEAALREGNARAAWKQRLTVEYFKNVKYNLPKVAPFDYRDIYTLVPLLVDISSVAKESEEIQREYFLAKLQVIEQDFVLSKDHKTRLPYLKKMYETVKTDYDIDWDNPTEIDHLFCSTRAQQMLGTMVERLPTEVLSLYPDKEGAQKLDNISIMNYVNTKKFRNAVARTYPELNENVDLGPKDEEDPASLLKDDVLLTLAGANDKNKNVALFDPDKISASTTDFLLGKDINITVTEKDPFNPKKVVEINFNNEDFFMQFLDSATGISSQCLNEFKTVAVYSKGFSDPKKDFFLINGKPLSKIIEEKEKDLGNDPQAGRKAKLAAGEMMRDALTDGKSVVTMMRTKILENGKVSFTHQELKVDLDKLNKIYRAKRSIFGKIMTAIGLRKANKFPSNKDRDAEQEKFKSTADYTSSLKATEDKFIETYNKNSQEARKTEEQKELKKGFAVKDKFINAYPEITGKVMEDNPDTIIKGNDKDKSSEREKLPPIMEVIEEEDMEIQAPIEEEDLAKSANKNSVANNF